MAFQSPNADLLPRSTLIIGDSIEEQGSGEMLAHVYPGTNTVTREFRMGAPSDVDRAVEAAQAAFPAWRALTGDKRRNLMFALASLLEAESMNLAPILIAENGSVAMTAGFMGYDGANKFRYCGGWADKLEYAGLGPNPQAHGVAAQVIPWNFPLMMLAWKIAPALAAGNTVVLKPAETTPLTALLFAEICQQAELPDGVVNIVTGHGDTGAELVKHPDINKVAFTGSTATGRRVAQRAAGRLIGCSLELGGKNPMIVLRGANLKKAAEMAVAGAFGSAGQLCVSIERVYVPDELKADFIEALRAATESLKVGRSNDFSFDVGSLTSAGQLARVSGFIDDAIENGAVLVAGGHADEPSRFPARPGDAREFSDRGILTAIGPVVGQVVRVTDRAA
mgnify:CR=1 FL=1